MIHRVLCVLILAIAAVTARPRAAVAIVLSDRDRNHVITPGEERYSLNPDVAGRVNDLPNGPIDQGELDKVLLGWGNSVAALGAATVPEPSALLLALATICAACSLHLRKSA